MGPASGGTTVLITGTNLAAPTAVTFAGVRATVVNSSASMIAVSTPVLPAGTAPVTVTTAAGSASSQIAFWAYGPPSITKIDGGGYCAGDPTCSRYPAFGPVKGGLDVVIQGRDVQFATSVMFGTRPATIDPRQPGNAATVGPQGLGVLLVKTPKAIGPGPVPIVVTTPMGTTRLDNAYDYYGQPTIARVTPTNGPVAGGNTITVEGPWLNYAENVVIGGGEATIVSRRPDALVLRVPPSGALKPGPAYINIRLAWAAAVLQQGYTYLGPTPTATTWSATPSTLPRILTVTPNSGIYSGGDVVIISGTNLATASTVTFGSATGRITARTDTSLTVVTPSSRTIGPVAVGVVTARGAASLPGGFTYWSPNM